MKRTLIIMIAVLIVGVGLTMHAAPARQGSSAPISSGTVKRFATRKWLPITLRRPLNRSTLTLY